MVVRDDNMGSWQNGYWRRVLRSVALAGSFAALLVGASGVRALAESVLITGGQGKVVCETCSDTLDAAEIYNTKKGKFQVLKNKMTKPRESHTQTLLERGGFLITGGFDGTGLATATAETFRRGKFLATANMSNPRAAHSATRLDGGKVLICGGEDDTGTIRDTCDIYTPKTKTFTPTANVMTIPREDHTATLLDSGKVLITGGLTTGFSTTDTAEVYDPVLDTFTATSNNLTDFKTSHTATLLANGKVLVAGGLDANALDTADLYDPTANSFTSTPDMNEFREDHTATLLESDQVLICGGEDAADSPESSFHNSCEIYDAVLNTFTDTANVMTEHRGSHRAVLLENGKVLLIGGVEEADAQISAELYTPTKDTFAPTGSMHVARSDFGAGSSSREK
jgi:Kelch motif protein/galactose oxidase-like protein